MTAPLNSIEKIAEEAGDLLRKHAAEEKQVDEVAQHDLKLRLDVETQDLITARILEEFPDHAIYGEEGIAGDQESPYQWVVDPIDGTVNYFFGIPHFCVSIALRHKGEIIAGVIHDPMMRETWSAERGGGARLNGLPINVSDRAKPEQAIVTVGFSKTRESIEAGLARYGKIAFQVRKTRMMGSAALAMAYIACGRLDAYQEEIISLWDIAAGQILIEEAGGKVDLTPCAHAEDKFGILASNGLIHDFMANA